MFGYLAPLIFPLFGEKKSQIGVCLDIVKILRTRAVPHACGKLRLECISVISGKVERKKAFDFLIEEVLASADPVTVFLSEKADTFGYLEVAFFSENPIFRRLDVSIGYSLYSRGGLDAFTVIPDTKFARPILIDQFRQVGRFSLVHSATYNGYGQSSSNSLFFINPYEKAVLIRVQASNGKKLTARIGVHEAKMLPLDELIDFDKPTCVQLTANNRIPAWDLKHSSGNLRLINSVDHLDVFRGTKAKQPSSVSRFIKDWIREKLQQNGILR